MADSTLTVHGERQHGKTTALLDVALANARRGLDVAFWSPTAQQSTEAFRRAHTIADRDAVPFSYTPSNGREAIRYSGAGRVRFIWGHVGRYDRQGFDMTIDDADHAGLVARNNRKGL
ncbi:hypothetical protein PBI_VALIDUS_92 [Mycobacterium phage Validus]|uniref:Uncharacterized protein n=1 Tax=Mycobacterium phage Validus TaxID=1414747 RepID=V5URR6_9CAUD|nr:hypothetical protein CC50_gp019 [Mycobacterium phage Validus]AHB79622.1 hypothetical protein PBI_VALIDUS_92 [Mycobacterium phage Validus]